jgi:hypothetical protein
METMISQRETGGRGTEMDSDATVVLRHGLTTAKKPSRTSRTESTAVFVGRASFQMIPARQKDGRGQDEVTLGAELRRAEVSAVEEAQQEVVEALRAEARALRAESELRVAAATAAASAARRTPTPGPTVIVASESIQVEEIAASEVPAQRRGIVLQVLPQVDVTEPIDARVRARAAPRARRGGVSPRTIVLALVAGASITLSAQAVMRRPSTTGPSVSAVIAPQPVPAAPVQAAVAGAPPAPAAPTVVASTATAAAPQVAVEPARPAVGPRSRVRPRPAVATVHAAGSPKLRRLDGAAWVDPFADPAAAKTTKATTTKATKTKATETAWVDPFVD